MRQYSQARLKELCNLEEGINNTENTKKGTHEQTLKKVEMDWDCGFWILVCLNRAYSWPRGDTNFISECWKYLSEKPTTTKERYFQHEKIKFVSPSGHVMFCLFYRYWWNSYIKHNFFFIHFRNSKIVQLKWSPRRNKDNNTYIFCSKVVSKLVTMATTIFSHVKNRNRIFTARDEDMIF